MSSPQRPSEALDADHCEDPRQLDAADARPIETPLSVKEAEEELARAEARAEAARARAAALRKKADAGLPSGSGETSDDQREATETEHPTDSLDIDIDTDTEETEPPTSKATRSRRRWLHRPGRKTVAGGAAMMLICTALAAIGYMEWQHRTIVHERQHAAEYAEAARQAVVTLMSIDANQAKEDLQRVIDNSTGQFKDQLSVTARNIADGIEQSKVSTKVTVDAVAVQSMTDDSAVVLVAAHTNLMKADNTKRQPASWRLRISLDRDGGQLKMSKVEFVQ